MGPLSKHAKVRCQQRGVPQELVSRVLELADTEIEIGGNCSLLRVSRRGASICLRDDRLTHVGVVWSGSQAQVVTVMKLYEGRLGRRYRRRG